MYRMKALARSYMWWPCLDKDIENAVQECSACQTVRQLPAATPLHWWKWPTRVWQLIHIEFCDQDKQYFLVLVDSNSKWLEVVHMTTTTSAKTTEVLRSIFAWWSGFRQWNHLSFCEFKPFLRGNGIKQTLVRSYHPASNGAAERSLQTVKSALMKQVLSDKGSFTLQHRLANFLLMYKSAPHTVTGVSLAENVRWGQVSLKLWRTNNRVRRNTMTKEEPSWESCLRVIMCVWAISMRERGNRSEEQW